MNKREDKPPSQPIECADVKIAEANRLRRTAFLRREQAKNPKRPSDVGRLLNDAATMEQNAEELEQDAKRLWRGM